MDKIRDGAGSVPYQNKRQNVLYRIQQSGYQLVNRYERKRFIEDDRINKNKWNQAAGKPSLF